MNALNKGIQGVVTTVIVGAMAAVVLDCTGANDGGSIATPDAATKAPEPPEKLRVGAILPLTGNLAFLGEPERNALLLAQEDINKNSVLGSRRIEVVFDDSQGNPKIGVTLANKMTSMDHLPAVITTGTIVAMPTLPVFERESTVQLAVSMHPKVALTSPWTFRIFPSGWQEAEVLLKRYRDDPPGKMAILYGKVPEMESEVQDHLLPGLEKQGVEVVTVDSYEIRERNFRDLVVRAKTKGANHILALGFGFNYPPLLKEARAQGYEGSQLSGGLGLLELSGSKNADLVEDTVFVGPRFSIEGGGEAWQSFAERYRTKFGTEPTYDAGFAYDTLQLVARAAKVEGTDAAAIKRGLLAVEDYPGVTGAISITKDGDAHVELSLATYSGGKALPAAEVAP